jgi:hypothetical protein
MLSTVAKRTTNLYKTSQIPIAAKKICKEVKAALVDLQRFIAKISRIQAINESLGTALSIPVVTRWSSTFTMVKRYMESEDKVLEILNENSEDLANSHTALMDEFCDSYLTYLEVVGPIASYITTLEVSIFQISHIKLFLGKQIGYFIAHFTVIC